METYIGVITKILDKDLYQVEVDIPEQDAGLQAFPLRGEVDEPRVGDVVFLRELDPEYKSYYLYEKLKENSFIGFRAMGKKVKITEEAIEMGVYSDNDEWYDENGGNESTPESFAYIKLNKEGEIEIKGTKITFNVTGGGDISFMGPGTLTINGGRAIPSGEGGPFWSGPAAAPPSGTAGISGNKITLG
jgi:hypothetical protein